MAGPAIATFGSARRNSLRGPLFSQADLSIAVAFSLKERTAVQFRTEVCNAFNKVNLDNPISCVDCQGGGLIINTSHSDHVVRIAGNGTFTRILRPLVYS
jgi:hypothetical protein